MIAAQTDLSASLLPAQEMALGLPALEASEVPVCGVPGLLRVCSRNGKKLSLYLQCSYRALTSPRNDLATPQATPNLPDLSVPSILKHRLHSPRLRTRSHHRYP